MLFRVSTPHDCSPDWDAAEETFRLSSGFVPFVLSDPAWLNIQRANLSPWMANGELNLGFFAVDNIVATPPTPTAVPEPASIVLIGTGALGLLRRRRLFHT